LPEAAGQIHQFRIGDFPACPDVKYLLALIDKK
jgi:hypothetical protein